MSVLYYIGLHWTNVCIEQEDTTLIASSLSSHLCTFCCDAPIARNNTCLSSYSIILQKDQVPMKQLLCVATANTCLLGLSHDYFLKQLLNT